MAFVIMTVCLDLILNHPLLEHRVFAVFLLFSFLLGKAQHVRGAPSNFKLMHHGFPCETFVHT